ncbi:MAG: bacillithiol biosynthesis protein BshC [Candidatus Thorarchaeota archaeon]
MVQPELIHRRTPNMGHEGNLVSFPVEKEYEFSPVNAVPLPGNKWYDQVEEHIWNSYRPLMKAVEGPSRIVVEERLEQALALTRWAYHNSETLGDWGMRIMNRLFNIEGKLGIPLIPASDEGIRRLLATGLELLVARKNREKFLAAHETTTEMILANGLRLSIGARDASYVPFFYECPGKDCYCARIELTYHANGSKAILMGKCPTCGDVIEIELDADSPDLSDHANLLSPRVDSRQIAVDTVLPIVAHVGGSGETAYYAQVIPAVRDIDIPFPLFIRYPRAFFNTPWSEQLAGNLKEKNYPVLHSAEMFKTTGKVGRFRRKKRYEDMNSMLAEFESILFKSHSELNQRRADLEEQRIKGEAKEDETILVDKLMVDKYLSWTYGQFAEGKLNQEGSWLWIEWALNAGFSDLFGPYFRAHVGEMKNGATFFVNFTL